MESIKVALLKNHPQNNYYFDDLEGTKWNEFKASIKTSGVIEPIICTKQLTIISGHQRVRACRELGITEVMCDIRNLDDELDAVEITKQLIETNIRQRGNLNCSGEQMSRIITALEVAYGIKKGAPIKPNNVGSSPDGEVKTQEDIASELGVNMESYRLFKKLKDLIPEFETMLHDGDISFSVASRIVAKLSAEDQKQLADTLPAGEKVTDAVAKHYIQIIQQKDEEVKKLSGRVNELVSMDLDKEKELDQIDERQQKRIDELESELAKAKAATDHELIEKANLAQVKEREQYERAERYKKEAENRKASLDKVMAQLAKTSNIGSEIDDMAAEIKDLENSIDAKDAEISALKAMMASAEHEEKCDIIHTDSYVTDAVQIAALSKHISGAALEQISAGDLVEINIKLRESITELEGVSATITQRVGSGEYNAQMQGKVA